MTVLFCDLVGSTVRAEGADPEDVRAMLSAYHEHVRGELERFGGTVEKFIGDAVMALFGAPVAHEDDPERAVRAALAIRERAVEEGELQVRIGITTGETLISLSADPRTGEGMASGDVVNTAARLQAAAAVDGILVDETTRRATRDAIEYREREPVEAKGKSEPLHVWEALEARARLGVDVAHEARAPLVGRERELSVLRDALERARHERIPQLATLVGVPGIGKSRLLYELSRIVDSEPELITWRQGRCLAYGDGVAFWALGEIVKAQAGILERDAEAEVAEKLRGAVEYVLADPGEGRWVESHLRPLVGLDAETGLGGDRRGEAFAAWRRFLEAVAEERALVLVFEDLHWADAGLLDFLDELVAWLSEVPLLVVCSARPELLERRPGWGGGKLNASTLALSPLSDKETSMLLARLLDSPLLAAETQRTLLARAEGNPLYAEQFARLYLERGSVDELPLPETLQGIVAARLDGLSTEEKAVLQDASVLGKVFWTGALRRDPREAGALLHSLGRKGFLTRQRRSSVEGESEWAFAHMLLRDVAYAEIPRAARADKHRSTAEWIEGLGRPDDHAELVAHHYSAALELARAAGQNTADLTARTRLALRAAGDRAIAVNAYAAAAAYYRDALALSPADGEERPQLLFQYARALHVSADDRSADALEEALKALLAVGDREAAAEAEVFLMLVWWHRGQRDEASAHLARAQELAGEAPSPATARVLASVARIRSIGGEPKEGLRIAREALALAEALQLEELQVHALTTIGMSKTHLGDVTGSTVDLERAFELALAASSPQAASIANSLAGAAVFSLDLRRMAHLFDEGLLIAERLGDGSRIRWLRGQQVFGTLALGRWDEALRVADEFIAECEAGSPHYLEHSVRRRRAMIRAARNDVEEALVDVRRAVAVARDAKDPQALLPALDECALLLETHGYPDEARELIQEAIELARTYPHAAAWGLCPGILFSRTVTVFESELREVIALAPAGPWQDLAFVSLDRDFVRAAEIWAEAGALPWEARARLRAAEELIQAGRRAEADEQLEQALAFYRSVGATFFIRQGEALLAMSA